MMYHVFTAAATELQNLDVRIGCGFPTRPVTIGFPVDFEFIATGFVGFMNLATKEKVVERYVKVEDFEGNPQFAPFLRTTTYGVVAPTKAKIFHLENGNVVVLFPMEENILQFVAA